ncbi:MAG: hypothetical protein IT566_01575 [Rhodospirillaceae bacterium]|nr:hypothetical protein [Rhodospirillaceae bacterium]
MLRSLGVIAALVTAAAAPASVEAREAGRTHIGNLSANPYAPGSTGNPASRFDADSVSNAQGRYGSPFSADSATNPYATNAPKLYGRDGTYRGKLSANPYDAESVANPYGRYGSMYSPDSINTPHGAGNPYGADSPHNKHGRGLGIFGAK